MYALNVRGVIVLPVRSNRGRINFKVRIAVGVEGPQRRVGDLRREYTSEEVYYTEQEAASAGVELALFFAQIREWLNEDANIVLGKSPGAGSDGPGRDVASGSAVRDADPPFDDEWDKWGM